MNLVQLSDMMRERADRGLSITDLQQLFALSATLKDEFKDELSKILLDEFLFRYKCQVDEENRKPWYLRPNFGLWGKSDAQSHLEILIAQRDEKNTAVEILKDHLKVLDASGHYAEFTAVTKGLLASIGIASNQAPLPPQLDSDPVNAIRTFKMTDPVLKFRMGALCQRAKEIEGQLESLLNRIETLEETEQRLSETVPGFSATDSVELKSKTLGAYAEACCPALINRGLGARVVASQHSLAVNAFLVDRTDLVDRTEESSGAIVVPDTQKSSVLGAELDAQVPFLQNTTPSSLKETIRSDIQEPSVLGAELDAQVPFLQNTTPSSLKETIRTVMASLYSYEYKSPSKLSDETLMTHVKTKAGGWNWFGFTPSEYETVNKLLKAAEQPIDDAAMMAALRRIERLEKLDKHSKKTTMFSEMRSAFASAHFSSSDKKLFTKTTEEVKNANDSLASQGENVYEQYAALEKQFGNLNEDDDLIDINSRHFRAKEKEDLKRLVYHIAHVNLLPKGLSSAERSNALGANLDDPRYEDLLTSIDGAKLFEASPSLYFVVLMISVELVRQKTKAINRVDSGEGYSKLQSLLCDFLTNRQADMRLRFDVNEEKKETEFNTVLVKELSETEFSWLLNYIPNKIAYPGSTCALAASALSVKLIGVNGTFLPRLQQSTSVDSNRSSVASVDSGTPDRRKSSWGFGGFGFGTPGRSVSQASQTQVVSPSHAKSSASQVPSGPMALPSSAKSSATAVSHSCKSATASLIYGEQDIAIPRAQSTSNIQAPPQNKASRGSAVDQNGAIEEAKVGLSTSAPASQLNGNHASSPPVTGNHKSFSFFSSPPRSNSASGPSGSFVNRKTGKPVPASGYQALCATDAADVPVRVLPVRKGQVKKYLTPKQNTLLGLKQKVQDCVKAIFGTEYTSVDYQTLSARSYDEAEAWTKHPSELVLLCVLNNYSRYCLEKDIISDGSGAAKHALHIFLTKPGAALKFEKIKSGKSDLAYSEEKLNGVIMELVPQAIIEEPASDATEATSFLPGCG